MINQKLLMKKLRSLSCLSPIQETSRVSQYKLSKQIYNNRQNRKIFKFIREEKQIQSKAKNTQELKRISTEDVNNYDENQLKELNFLFQSEKKKYHVDELQILNQKADTNSVSGKSFLKRRQTMINSNRKAMFNKNKNLLPRQLTNDSIKEVIRLKSLTQTRKKSKSNSFEPLSPFKLRKLVTMGEEYEKKSSLMHKSKIEKMRISLKDEQLRKGVENIISVVGKTKQSEHYFIPHTLIFEKICEKYGFPFGQTLKPPSTNPEQDQYPLEIPYCQFVSLKDSRNSIDRIFNMSLKSAQKICFKIYDRNMNGIIDEKDIIQLFSIANTNEAMQKDLQVIIRNYKFPNKKSSSKNLSRITEVPDLNPNVSRHYNNNTSSKSKMQLSSISESGEKVMQEEKASNKFRKSKFFTFFETKKQFYKQKQTATVSLTWNDFQKAFADSIPKIFFHLLDFLFNINSESIFARELKEFLSDDNPIIQRKNSTYSNNVKGPQRRESVRSNQLNGIKHRRFKTLHENQQQTNETGKKSKKNIQIELSSQRINRMINEVKSIEQFEKLKYE